MTGIRNLIALLTVLVFGAASAEWAIDVEYAIENDARAGKTEYAPLGAVLIDRLQDGNFTGRFRSVNGISETLKAKLTEAAKNSNSIYRVRAGKVFSFSEPCLLLRSNLAHLFQVSIDPEKQSIFSLSVFPDGLYEGGADYSNCEGVKLSSDARFTSNVRVVKSGELPSPDTVSYIQKMERERHARQHGAQQDNRSFIAKYWMYIVPVVAFMVISNVIAPEQGGSEQYDLYRHMTDNTSMAAKVAEVFLTAGHAFQKLGDLTLQLHSGGAGGVSECEENKWGDKDVDNLRDALTRFAHELDNISDSVSTRTTRAIKTDLKRQNIINAQPMPVINSASMPPVGNTIIGHPPVRTRPAPYPTNAPVAKRAAQVRPTQHFAQPVGSSVPRMRYAPAASGASGLIQPKPQQGAVQPVPMIQIAPNNSNPVRTTTLGSPRTVSSSPNTAFEPSPVSQPNNIIPQQLRNAPSAPEPYRLPR